MFRRTRDQDNAAIRFATTVALIATTSVLLSAAAAAAPEVPITANEAQPAEGVQTLRLRELWRIGGPDDEENLLGVIDRAVADDAGNLYLLDIQLTEAQVFGPDGRYLRTLGKAGDGPGELRRPADLLLLPDGTVGLVQSFPGRIVKLDVEGIPAGELRPGGEDPAAGGFFALRGAEVVADRLICSGVRISRGETSRTARFFVAAFGMDGHETTMYHEQISVREMGQTAVLEKDQYFPGGDGWAALPDGRVVLAPRRNEYRLEIHAPDGRLERIITRRYESCPRTDEEKAEIAAARTGFRGGRNRNRPDFVVEPTERDVLQIHAAPAGEIWVLPSRGIRGQPAGIHSTWDVFDGQGRFSHQLAVACEADGREDAVFFPGGDLLVIVREHAGAMRSFRGQAAGFYDDAAEADGRPLEVIVYRMLS